MYIFSVYVFVPFNLIIFCSWIREADYGTKWRAIGEDYV